MRLWSICPDFLDRMGLLGLWREALQAQKILRAGPPYKMPYGNHPQLQRFKDHEDPVVAIRRYLANIYTEGVKRGYNFNRDLIYRGFPRYAQRIPVTFGQVDYEIRLLLHKLRTRDKEQWAKVMNELSRLEKNKWRRPFQIDAMNYSFTMEVKNKNTEPWEKVKKF